jgi:hypothetical protein
MLDDDELQALARSIRKLGQIHPIMLDRQGRVLDGRNRLKACEIAGIEPRFATYEGDDPDSYALSVNIRRRNLTKGQMAMIATKACSPTAQTTGSRGEQATVSLPEQTARSLSERTGVSLGRIGMAYTVLRHAADLVDPVISGAIRLDKAYKVARERKTQAASVESKLARLRVEDPALADRVVEGELTLLGAWAERKARAEEEDRQRKVATQFLCEIVPPLAQTRGTDTFRKFDPRYVATGRAITREVIEQAMTALREMAAIWQENDLT